MMEEKKSREICIWSKINCETSLQTDFFNYCESKFLTGVSGTLFSVKNISVFKLFNKSRLSVLDDFYPVTKLILAGEKKKIYIYIFKN